MRLVQEPNLTPARYLGKPCPKCGLHVRYVKNGSCVWCHKALINKGKIRKRDRDPAYREYLLGLNRTRSRNKRRNPEYWKLEYAREKERYATDDVFRRRKVLRVIERERQMQQRSLGGRFRQEIQAIYDLAASLGLTVDHIEPLNGIDACGLHVPWNLQIMTRRDNSSKGNKRDDARGQGSPADQRLVSETGGVCIG